MPYPRAGSAVLLPALLSSLLLSFSACAVDRVDTEDPPASAATIQFPETEAGIALAAALSEASRTNRNVFAHTGADW